MLKTPKILRGCFATPRECLAIYQKKDNNFTWKSPHLYGSSRLGIWKAETRIQGTYKLNVAAMEQSAREYELTNHLGNVLSTITDKGVITSAQDYYPFGLTLASRSFTEGGSSYRYSFNGKEDDKETGLQDYGMRLYLKKLGRFPTVDPIGWQFPELTPYQFASNTPIESIDLDGLEAKSSKEGFWTQFGKSVLNGGINLIKHAANNPHHAGYGYHPKMKPGTPEQLKSHDFDLSKHLDPNWQIENFASNLVNGTSNFVGGIIEGNGERTARAIPQLFSALGTMYGIGRLGSTPKIPLVSSSAGLSKLRLAEKSIELASKNGVKPYVISAVTDTKTGRTFFGENRAIKSLDDVNPILREKLPIATLEKWSTYNCAECDAFNKALNAGAKWENLGDLHTKRFDTKTKSYIDMERCDNCKTTFKDKSPTSE